MDMGTKWMHLRCTHSRLLGYWVSELGGIADICHIWEYGMHRAGLELILTWCGWYSGSNHMVRWVITLNRHGASIELFLIPVDIP